MQYTLNVEPSKFRAPEFPVIQVTFESTPEVAKMVFQAALNQTSLQLLHSVILLDDTGAEFLKVTDVVLQTI